MVERTLVVDDRTVEQHGPGHGRHRELTEQVERPLPSPRPIR